MSSSIVIMNRMVLWSFLVLALVAYVAWASETEKTLDASTSSATTVVLLVIVVVVVFVVTSYNLRGRSKGKLTKCMTCCLVPFIFIWETLKVVGNCICAEYQRCRERCRQPTGEQSTLWGCSKGDYGAIVRKRNFKHRRPVGLYNQGNTCYFNAIMQNINQTFLLEKLLEDSDPMGRSEEIPDETNTRIIRKLVGKNFYDVIRSADKDVLVLFAAPDSRRCREVANMFENISRKTCGARGVMFAQIDAVANRVPGVDITRFPSVKLYPHDHDVVYDFPKCMEINEDNLTKFLNSRESMRCKLSLRSCCVAVLYALWTVWYYLKYAVLSVIFALRRCCSGSQSLTEALRDFYRNMSKISEKNLAQKYPCFDESYVPHFLLSTLRHRSERFQNMDQQDSHELLRHLMDGVKEEEKQMCGGRSVGVQSEPTPYLQLTTIDQVFGGHFLTVFHCSECNKPYHLFEPFLDLSLPVAFDNHFSDASSASSSLGVKVMSESDRRMTAPPGTSPQYVTVDMEAYDPRHSVTPARVPTFGGNDSQYTDAVRDIVRRLAAMPASNDVSMSLLDSLRFYTREEKLDEHLCLECNRGRGENYMMTPGTKQTIIYNPPAILTIHLKRFEMTRGGYNKVCRHVAFETTLDLAPYCSVYCKRQREQKIIKYSLYGVVVHQGDSLRGGHYTACVKARTVDVSQTKTFLQNEFLKRDVLMDKTEFVKLVEGSRKKLEHLETPGEINSNSVEDKWYSVSDTMVHETDETEVLRQQAYLLFYERIY